MRVIGTLAGASLFGAVLLALPALVGVSSGHEDLRVEVRSAGRYGVRPTPAAGGNLVRAKEPEEASAVGLLPGGGSGLDLTTWRASYGSAYEREVTWPTLVGPFNSEDDYVCGYTLWLGAGLFDTSEAGAGLSRLVRAKLRSSLPKSIDIAEHNIHVRMPELDDVKMEVVLDSGTLTFALTLDFADGSRFAVPAVPVRLGISRGAPYLERAGAIRQPVLTGPLRDELIRQAGNEGASQGAAGGCFVGFLFFGVGALIGCPVGEAMGRDEGVARAQKEIPGHAGAMATENVDRALADLALGLRRLREPWRPVPGRGDEIRLRLAQAPTVAPGGIRLDVCTRVTMAEPKTDGRVPGSVAVPDAVVRSSPSSGPTVGLALSPAAINQLVHYLWQSGQLAKLGESKSVIDALDEGVRLSALDFRGFAPGLPPTLAPMSSPGRLSFVVGDVSLGGLRGTAGVDVVAHGRADLALEQHGDDIRLRGFVNDLRLNCVGRSPDLAVLTPCLGDLLPVAREMAKKRHAARSFASADLLGKLPAVGFKEAKLRLSDLRVSTTESPPTIDLSVKARFE